MINIILAEDHHIVRGGVRSLLEKDGGLAITGEAMNGAEVLTLLENGASADVVLADMNMPVMGGIELTAHIKEKYPAAKVIILSALDHEKYVIKAFQAGASGYVLKSVSTDELIFAIKHTHQHTQYICSDLAARLLHRLMSVPEPVSSESALEIDFTSRDVEILDLISQGFTNQEIADRMFSSKRTIENHRQTLIDKTNSRNTVALIRFAILNGVI
ncbi:MAG: response regulator transcription factor [Bacteroidota bacterium]|nr:response regulator transcription factor [Bacteroidota bacterium]